MRKLVLAVALFFVLLFTLPLVLLTNKENDKSISDYENYINADSEITIDVYDVSKNKVVKMDLEEYVSGVVVGEMPMSFDIEALKAQCLASRTYAVLRLKQYGGKGCANHPEADVCTDSTHCQAYIEPRLSKDNMDKLKAAIEETKGEVIIYQNNLIDAVFHSTSGGKTENSEDIWSSRVPYLRSVISQYEQESPKLITATEMSITDFVSKIRTLDKTINLDANNIKKEIRVLERSEGGRIKEIKIGNKSFKGEAIRKALGLNSSNFTITINGNMMHFTVVGNGHGIGMSQYGADGMAKAGYTYADIIKHYYQDVDIINIYDYASAGTALQLDK